MNRRKLIQSLAERLPIGVLYGLETDHLQRIRNWYDRDRSLDPHGGENFPSMLEREDNPHNVYLILWQDGMGYVGRTGSNIFDRMEHHFQNVDMGVGNFNFIVQWERGVSYRFHCLHTGLSESDSIRLEIEEITKRGNLFNVANNRKTIELQRQEAERGAMARYRYNKRGA